MPLTTTPTASTPYKIYKLPTSRNGESPLFLSGVIPFHHLCFVVCLMHFFLATLHDLLTFIFCVQIHPFLIDLAPSYIDSSSHTFLGRSDCSSYVYIFTSHSLLSLLFSLSFSPIQLSPSLQMTSVALSPTHIFYISFELSPVFHYVDHSLFFEIIGLYETIFSYSSSFPSTSCVDSFPYTQPSLLEYIKTRSYALRFCCCFTFYSLPMYLMLTYGFNYSLNQIIHIC